MSPVRLRTGRTAAVSPRGRRSAKSPLPRAPSGAPALRGGWKERTIDKARRVCVGPLWRAERGAAVWGQRVWWPELGVQAREESGSRWPDVSSPYARVTHVQTGPLYQRRRLLLWCAWVSFWNPDACGCRPAFLGATRPPDAAPPAARQLISGNYRRGPVLVCVWSSFLSTSPPPRPFPGSSLPLLKPAVWGENRAHEDLGWGRGWERGRRAGLCVRRTAQRPGGEPREGGGFCSSPSDHRAQRFPCTLLAAFVLKTHV